MALQLLRTHRPDLPACSDPPLLVSGETSIINGTKPAAITIGLDSMQGLQAARILRDRGIPVIGIARDPNHHACRSNACEKVLILDTGTREFVDELLRIGPDFANKPVLIPCQDSSVLMVSRNRDELSRYYHFSLPSPEITEQLIDKESFFQYAQQQGLPVPATFRLDTRADAEQAAARLTYPCMLKPRVRSATWNENSKVKVLRAGSAEELLQLFDRCRAWADILVAQQWIPGGDSCLYSCNCYFGADSKPLVTFVARKLRQWPPDIGVSCLGEEVRNDAVLQTTLDLFSGIGYRGLGYVEIKRDALTGKHYIIEPNIGRPTGRSAIAEAGGVELLYTMYCDTLGLPLPENRTQHYGGAKWIDLRHDLQSALAYWRRGELTLREWWQSFKGPKAYAVFSWRDPAPFLYDLKRAIRKYFAREKRP